MQGRPSGCDAPKRQGVNEEDLAPSVPALSTRPTCVLGVHSCQPYRHRCVRAAEPCRRRTQPGPGDPQLDRAPSVDGTTPARPREGAAPSGVRRRLPRGAGRASLRPTRGAVAHARDLGSRPRRVRTDPARAPRAPRRTDRGTARRRVAAASVTGPAPSRCRHYASSAVAGSDTGRRRASRRRAYGDATPASDSAPNPIRVCPTAVPRGPGGGRMAKDAGRPGGQPPVSPPWHPGIAGSISELEERLTRSGARTPDEFMTALSDVVHEEGPMRSSISSVGLPGVTSPGKELWDCRSRPS